MLLCIAHPSSMNTTSATEDGDDDEEDDDEDDPQAPAYATMTEICLNILTV